MTLRVSLLGLSALLLLSAMASLAATATAAPEVSGRIPAAIEGPAREV